MKTIIAATVVAVALVGVADATAAQESYDVPGRAVAVYNLAGQVEIVPGTGSVVVVEVVRGGPDADRLAVEVGNVDGRSALRVIYPSDEVVYARMGRGSNADVRVRGDGTFYGNGPGRGDRVRIRGGGDGLEAHADLRVHVPADVDVSVYLAVGAATARDLRSNLALDLGAAPAEVAGVVGRVEVDTGSGRVEVSDVQGDVWIDTGSGNVEVHDVTGEEVSVDTGSGSVTGSRIQVHTLNIDTGSGRIEFDGVAASDVVCDTGSGSVELRFTTDVDHVEVDSGSGGVALWLPDNAGAEVEVDTGSGRIEVDIPIRVERSERTYLRGAVGDGNGRITVDTGSGSIVIRAN